MKRIEAIGLSIFGVLGCASGALTFARHRDAAGIVAIVAFVVLVVTAIYSAEARRKG